MKKGFTLVELLGTIILLGLVSLIIAIPIAARINKTSTKINNATMKVIKEHVLDYISSNKNDFRSTKAGTKYYITLDELEFNRDGFDVKINKKKLEPSTILEIILNNNGDYDVSVVEDMNTNMSTIGEASIGASVRFNGFNWKVVSKNTSKKTVRLICDEFVGSVQAGPNTKYVETYIYQWLNEYFASMLNYTNIIKEGEYGLIDIPTTSEAKDLATYEYAVRDNQGNLTTNKGTSNNAPLIRPVIEVYEGTVVTSVSDYPNNGEDPFLVLRKYSGELDNDCSCLIVDSSLKNANISVGEYVRASNEIYRIIEYGEDMVKMIIQNPAGPLPYNKYAEHAGEAFNLSNGIGYSLNSYIPEDFLSMNSVYVGSIYTDFANYKNTTLRKTGVVYRVYKALPKIGEILTVPIDNDSSWTMSMADSSHAYAVTKSGLSKVSYSTSLSGRYTIYVSSKQKISYGRGTLMNPYYLPNIIVE